MLVKFIQKPSASNRGKAAGLIKYIFGATKDIGMQIDGHRHSGDAQKVHFVTASKNLCIVDPLYIKTKDGFEKINGQDADLKEIISQFSLSESRNNNAEYPTEHIIITLPANESLTISQWGYAAEFLMKKIGYEDCTWVCTFHEDTDNQHCHIALCNISNKSPHNSINPANKWQLATEARVILEQHFGLHHDPSPLVDRDKDFNPNLSKNSLKNSVRAAIRFVLAEHGSMPLPMFIKEMQKQNIGVFTLLKSNETEVQGLSFSLNGQRIRASALGNYFSTKAIMADVSYSKERDRDEVLQLNASEQIRMQAYDDIQKYAAEKAQDLGSAEHYVVTVMAKEEIKSSFTEQPLIVTPINTLSNAFVCAVRANLNSRNDESSPVEIEYTTGSYSKYLDRVEKKLTAQKKRKLAQLAAKQQNEQRKILQNLLRAFCFSSPRNHRLHFSELEQEHKTPILLSERCKFLSATSPVVLLSRQELISLLNTANVNAVKLFLANEQKFERSVHLNERNQIILKNKPANMSSRLSKALDHPTGYEGLKP